jgi:hypothetical protein
MIGQPHPVVCAIELEALAMHGKGIDLEDVRLAMSPADLPRCRFVEGQMHVLACPRLQPI